MTDSNIFELDPDLPLHRANVVVSEESSNPNRRRWDISMVHHRAIARSLTAFLGLIAIGCGSGNSLNADAGPDTRVAVGESPTFNGCDSSGDITNYQWIIRQAPESMPQDVDKAIRDSMTECSFTLEASMIADEIGRWTVEMIITGADGATNSDDIVVTVVEQRNDNSRLGGSRRHRPKLPRASSLEKDEGPETVGFPGLRIWWRG